MGTPDLKRQEKISEFIEKAEKAKELRKEADDLTKDFLKSVFLEMFEELSLSLLLRVSAWGLIQINALHLLYPKALLLSYFLL